MLLLKGNVGKSVVVAGIQKYNNAPVFIYGEYMLNMVQSYFLDSREHSQNEFIHEIEEVLKEEFSHKSILSMIVIYTNMPESEIQVILGYAKKLEDEKVVSNVVIACKEEGLN